MAKDEIDYARLCRVIPHARRSMEPFRRARYDLVKLVAGSHWGDITQKTQPVNLLGMYQSILARNLVPKDPRVKINTFDETAKPIVGTMERWANREIQRMNLANTLRRIVVDALHMIGIAKVGIASPADSAKVSWGLKAGQPCIWRVDLDDFVYDHHARDMDECTYVGHYYRCPIEAVINDKRNYGKARKELVPQFDRRYNEVGDEKVHVLGRGYTYDNEEFLDQVGLWEIWVPGWNQIVTLMSDEAGHPILSSTGDPLRVQDWIGPYCGPYKYLRFETVGGNAMSKGPMLDLIDLHEPANRAFRKIVRQADRLKKTTPVRSAEDFNRFQESNDGDGWRCDTEPPKEVVSGAPDPQLLAVFTVMKDLFSWQAGNMDAVAGLAPQAKTLGQDRMLTQSASAGIADKQDTTISFTADVIDDLCWWWKHHPTKVMRSDFQVPNTNVTVLTQATPADRNSINWDDLEIITDPYSFHHQSPQERAQALVQIMTQVLTPIMPLLQQQGIGIDVQQFLGRIGDYMDQPDLKYILHLVDPVQPQGAQGDPSQVGPQPAQTERRYVRENRSEATQQGNQRMAMAMMMGKNPGGGQHSLAEMNGKV